MVGSAEDQNRSLQHRAFAEVSEAEAEAAIVEAPASVGADEEVTEDLVVSATGEEEVSAVEVSVGGLPAVAGSGPAMMGMVAEVALPAALAEVVVTGA